MKTELWRTVRWQQSIVRLYSSCTPSAAMCFLTCISEVEQIQRVSGMPQCSTSLVRGGKYRGMLLGKQLLLLWLLGDVGRWERCLHLQETLNLCWSRISSQLFCNTLSWTEWRKHFGTNFFAHPPRSSALHSCLCAKQAPVHQFDPVHVCIAAATLLVHSG